MYRMIVEYGGKVQNKGAQQELIDQSCRRKQMRGKISKKKEKDKRVKCEESVGASVGGNFGWCGGSKPFETN